MESSSQNESEGTERVVYVMPGDPERQDNDDSIDLASIWNVLWKDKLLIIAITTVFALSAIAYALTLTHWYRSEVLLAPAEERSMNAGIAGQLGSLVGLAGLSTGGGGSIEALATLRSRDFTRAFIEEQDLLPVLFANKWNPDEQRWLDANPVTWPDLNAAVRYFGGDLRQILEDRQTGLVTVAVEWTDPELAARWVTLLVDRLNDHMRTRALEQANRNIAYLQEQLAATSTVALQQAASNLLEREHQTLMLARGNPEYAFRIIDSAEVPDTPSRPNRRLMVTVFTLFGGIVAVFLVLARDFVRNRNIGTKNGADESAT